MCLPILSAGPLMALLVQCPRVRFTARFSRLCPATRSSRCDERGTRSKVPPISTAGRAPMGSIEQVVAHQGNSKPSGGMDHVRRGGGQRAIRTQHRRAASTGTSRAGAVRPRIGDLLLLVGSSAPADHGAGSARWWRGVRAGGGLAGGGWGVHGGCGTRGRLFCTEGIDR